MTDGWRLVGEFKSPRWRSLLKELEELIENLPHFYLKEELLRLFSSHKNTSKTCFPPEQKNLMLKMHCRKKLPFHDQLCLVQPSPARVQLETSPPVSKALPVASVTGGIVMS